MINITPYSQKIILYFLGKQLKEITALLTEGDKDDFDVNLALQYKQDLEKVIKELSQ